MLGSNVKSCPSLGTASLTTVSEPSLVSVYVIVTFSPLTRATVTSESPTSKSLSVPMVTTEFTAPVTTILVSDQPAGMLISWTV